jgi:GT2 family glycosyltransferase
MNFAGLHLFIATPCYGGMVHQRYMQSIIGLLQAGQSHGFRVSVELLGYDSLVTRSRNTLVAEFLNTAGATHLLFLDADIACEAEQVLRMLQFEEDVVAGMYPLRMIHWDPAAVERAGEEESYDTAPLRYMGAPEGAAERESRDGFVTGLYAGAGCLLIRRAALERMMKAYPETRYTAALTQPGMATAPNQYALFDCLIDSETGQYLSEDYAFCLRWRKIGGRIWLDTLSRLSHIGPHEFSGNPRSRF